MAAAATPAFGQRTPVVPEGTRVTATLTPGFKTSGELVFASGQLGGRDSTIEGQTRIALESTKKVFEAAGTTMANAVKCTVYLTDVKDFGAMNTVYSTFWPTSPPARTTVVVAALVAPTAKVEITCVAAMPAK
ncbi:MAG: RidA family protein [Phycisphaerae bacterium]|nr:RidA family protein [Gemmatimonadaceae bacterium]